MLGMQSIIESQRLLIKQNKKKKVAGYVFIGDTGLFDRQVSLQHRYHEAHERNDA